MNIINNKQPCGSFAVLIFNEKCLVDNDRFCTQTHTHTRKTRVYKSHVHYKQSDNKNKTGRLRCHFLEEMYSEATHIQAAKMERKTCS